MKPVLPVSRCSIEVSPGKKIRRHSRVCGSNQATTSLTAQADAARMAGPVQHSLLTTRKRENEELACVAGLEMKKMPALSGGSLTQTMRTRQFLLPVRDYVLASANSVRPVTVGCDAHHCLRRSILAGGEPGAPVRPPKCWRRNARPTPCSRDLWRPVGTVYASASRRGCWLHPFGLCANLRFCDESADSQAVPPIGAETRGNQLRNIALATSRWCRNITTGRSVSWDSGVCPSHPQTFPQARGVSGSGF